MLIIEMEKITHLGMFLCLHLWKYCELSYALITNILKNNKDSTIRTIFEFQFHFLYLSFMEWLFLFDTNFGLTYSIYYIVKPTNLLILLEVIVKHKIRLS